MILYECLTGEVPFRGNNYLGIISQVLTHKPTPPSQLRPELGIPDAVEAVVMRAMEKDRARRYQTMAELERDLDRLLAGDQNVGFAPARRRARRARRGAAALAAAGRGAAVALAGARGSRSRAPGRAGGRRRRCARARRARAGAAAAAGAAGARRRRGRAAAVAPPVPRARRAARARAPRPRRSRAQRRPTRPARIPSSCGVLPSGSKEAYPDK